MTDFSFLLASFLDFEPYFPFDDEIWLFEPIDYRLPMELVPTLISGMP
jgi:hypothetical protein